jgi:hypothetical protein
VPYPGGLAGTAGPEPAVGPAGSAAGGGKIGPRCCAGPCEWGSARGRCPEGSALGGGGVSWRPSGLPPAVGPLGNIPPAVGPVGNIPPAVGPLGNCPPAYGRDAGGGGRGLGTDDPVRFLRLRPRRPRTDTAMRSTKAWGEMPSLAATCAILSPCSSVPVRNHTRSPRRR